ncbi:MAG: hypothetical protein M0Q53_18895 [Prolixibacteraceae bacterium]|jgi:hypothetical protein|nr:hypothetical protein [Prolixibacteraceae bacterium]
MQKIYTSRKAILYFFLFFTLLTVAGCRKEIVVVVETGDLVVNARDGAGASLVGHTVYLYNNQADFNNNLYSQTRITDNSGQVVFLNLYPGIYYADCDFTGMLGQTIIISGSGSVSAGYETTITIRP